MRRSRHWGVLNNNFVLRTSGDDTTLKTVVQCGDPADQGTDDSSAELVSQVRVTIQALGSGLQVINYRVLWGNNLAETRRRLQH
jgi:hypothetical protein